MVKNKTKTHFDKQVDKIRAMLSDKIADLKIMNNETFTETKYAIRHKPTQKWVHFIRDDSDLKSTNIELVDFKNCLISPTKSILEKFLKRKELKKVLNYGNYNFLEFELVKIKTTYTIEG